MFIQDPDFFPSRIPDPLTKKKDEEERGNFFVLLVM
jgi:hypothetical protein